MKVKTSHETMSVNSKMGRHKGHPATPKGNPRGSKEQKSTPTPFSSYVSKQTL